MGGEEGGVDGDWESADFMELRQNPKDT